MVLWDLKTKAAEFRWQSDEPLRSVSWHHEGKQFMCSHTDGSLTTWLVRQPKPVNVTHPHGSCAPPLYRVPGAAAALASLIDRWEIYGWRSRRSWVGRHLLRAICFAANCLKCCVCPFIPTAAPEIHSANFERIRYCTRIIGIWVR